MAGRFITFEGLDGSGKSTHLRHAAVWLGERGIPCATTKEPGGTPLGEALRSVFLDPRWGTMDGTVELLVVFASRRQHLLEVIDPALSAGTTMLCDRFTDSTRAYQGGGRGITSKLIDQVDRFATGSRVPGRTLLFDLPVEIAYERVHSGSRRQTGQVDRLDREDLGFHRRVRETFLDLAAAEPDRFRVVDSSGEKAETERQVRHALEDLFATTSPPAAEGGP